MSTATVLKSHNLFLTSAKVEKLANHGEFFGQLRNENGIAAAAAVVVVVGVNDLCNGVVNSRRPNVVATVTVVEVPLGVQFLAAVPIVRPRIRFHYGRGGNSLVQLQAQTRRKCPSKPSAPMIQLNTYECFP